MKLTAASIALALLQVTAAASSRRTEEAAGQCLAATSGYNDYYGVNDNADQYADEGAEENNAQGYQTAYYNGNNAEYNNNTKYNNSNAGYSLDANLASLAEAFGLELAEEGESDMYMGLAASGHSSTYYNEEEAKALGIDDEHAFEALSSVLYKLASNGGLGNMHIDDGDETNEALRKLVNTVRAEAALDSADFTTGDATDYESVLEDLHINAEELDEGTINDLKVKVALKNGDFMTFLETEAPYGSEADWGTLIPEFLGSIGLDEDYEINSSIAAKIYEAEYQNLELGCQAKMVEQYGAEEAASLGYIVSQASSSLNSLSTGSKAGIAAGVVVAVGALASFFAYRGRVKVISDAETPLGYRMEVDGKTPLETMC